MSTATTAEDKQPIPNQVFVGGMTADTSVEQLTKHFQSLKLAPVGPPTFFRTPDGVSKGCALVPFASPEAQEAAIVALQESKLGESTLIARIDRGPRKPRREVNQDGSYLYVGNLDPEITPHELADLFAAEGPLQNCTISRKRRSNERSLGWATLQLTSVELADKAQARLNGSQFKDRTLTVEPLKSIPRPVRKSRARKQVAGGAAAPADTPEPAIDPCVVWVGNLPFETVEDTLRTLFAAHGAVKDVVITRDKRSKQSRGWGTVTYEASDAAELSIEKLQGTMIGDRAINVQIRRGPRPRRRRQQAAQGADAQAAADDSESKDKGPRRNRQRRPRRFRRPSRGEEGGEQKQTTRPPRQRRERRDTEEQGQQQEASTGDAKQNKRRRARRRRVDQKEETAVTVHTQAADSADGDDAKGEPRRRRRRRFKPAGEEEAAETKQERREPDRVVPNPECHLYVRNLPFESTANDLKTFFEAKAGPVASATITVNAKGLSRGWGTVEMASAKDVPKALALDKEDFNKRALFVRVDNRVRGDRAD